MNKTGTGTTLGFYIFATIQILIHVTHCPPFMCCANAHPSFRKTGSLQVHASLQPRWVQKQNRNWEAVTKTAQLLKKFNFIQSLQRSVS